MEHHIKPSFKQIIVFDKSLPEIDDDTLTQVTTVYVDTLADGCIELTINTLTPHLARTRIYAGFNAEYLYFSFSCSHSVAEFLAFHTEERRGSMLTYFVD